MNKVGLVSMFLCAMGSEFIWSEKEDIGKIEALKFRTKLGEREQHMGTLHLTL